MQNTKYFTTMDKTKASRQIATKGNNIHNALIRKKPDGWGDYQ